MKYYFCILLILTLGMSCTKQSAILYQSDEFTVYSDKVVQGEFEAVIVSPQKIVSNYRSSVSDNYSRLITFKFSINEKDNEKLSGQDHWLIIGDEHISPLIVFGQENLPNSGDPGTKLAVNYEYTFRLDMRPVLQQFEEKGFYEAFDGSRITKNDFKAVYVAGGSAPLTWDFSNLEENNLALSDPDGDGIYEITVVLNPYYEKQDEINIWSLSKDNSDKPHYQSDQKIVDALFNLSLEEATMNIEPDSTLRTGAKWGGVWTRDVSYSILLAFAYNEPEVAKISLMQKVNRNRIVQDTGSGGAWPVSTDRTTWALGAWEVYKATGDRDWLETAYTVIKNTLNDDYKTLQSEHTGMYRGESSFLDWREQTYPKWMSNMDIYVSENLGTNVVHYQAHIILTQMAKLLGEPYADYENRASKLKKAINQHLWMEDKGYYAQYLYGRTALIRSDRFEALGEALAVLFDVADENQIKSILSNSPVTPYGTTCIYPQIPGIAPYHNNGIWPFVQSYWNLAAAKAGNEAMLNHGLAAIYRAGALFLTNYENFVAETGDYVGTEINSHRMLWSMAGNLAMVHRVFMGMNFEVNGIRFSPVVPEAYGGVKELSNFKYRDAVLKITVEGHGNQIASITLDGQSLEDAFFPATLSGKHSVVIKMANNPMNNEINLIPNMFSLTTPNVRLYNQHLSWDEIDGAVLYQIYKDGDLISKVKHHAYEIETGAFAEFAVTAIDANGFESFSSEPVWVYKNKLQTIELENYMQKSTLPYVNFTGKGFVEITPLKNNIIQIDIQVDEPGKYLFDVRYSNGTGPWNTDNNCAIRSLYINDQYKGVLVLPQRGTNEWSDWGYSNSVGIDLKKGKNSLLINYEVWNTNMDIEINDALLDHIRLIKKE